MSVSYITFKLKEQSFGIELGKIREILTYREMTEIPDSKDWLKGVLDVRGKAMPVVDLRIMFSQKSEMVYNQNTVIIAIKQPKEALLGIIVDEIQDIESIETQNIIKSGDENSVIDKRYITGYIKQKSKMLILLDIDLLVERAELERLFDAN